MIKYFCDSCGDEITRENQFEYKEFTVGKNEVRLKVVEPSDDHDAVCLYCVLKEVNKLDNRPKVYQEGSE